MSPKYIVIADIIPQNRNKLNTVQTDRKVRSIKKQIHNNMY